MSEFFNLFPLTPYTMDPNGKNFNLITNLLFRTKLYNYIKNFTTIYYTYTIKDGDTPDIIAEKYYGDSEAHWLVMYTNDIIDPQFDWLLNQTEFNNYIISKYGSVANAMTTIHHYQKIITSYDSNTRETSVKTYDVDFSDQRTNVGDPTLPYDTYSNLPEFEELNPPGTFPDGSGVQIFISKAEISCYDYEYDLNEAKREIKLIDKVYWPQIKTEFQNLTSAAKPQQVSYLRTIKTV